MSDTARAPEPEPARLRVREADPRPPMPESMQRALEAQQRKAAPEAEQPPPDPEKELAKPLDALPKWEAEHTFKLSVTLPSLNGGPPISEIRIKAPTGLDIFEIGGLPNKTRWSPEGMTIDMDIPRFKAWITRLAVNCDMPTFYRIPAKDLRSIYEWLNTELNQAGN